MGAARGYDRRVEVTVSDSRKSVLQPLSALLLIALCLSACRFNPDMRQEGLEYLHGRWTQDSVAMQGDLLQYTLHELTVTPDSIYFTLHTTARVKKMADSCYNDGTWVEYARGLYVVRQDSLLVEGWYRQADGQLKTAGCHHIGKYRPRFLILHHTADSLILEERLSRQRLLLRRVAGTPGEPSQQ